MEQQQLKGRKQPDGKERRVEVQQIIQTSVEGFKSTLTTAME